MTIMPGHNDIGGIPCHALALAAHRRGEGGIRLRGILHQRHDGHGQPHKSALHRENQSQALEKSINAGMDMHMYSPDSFSLPFP